MKETRPPLIAAWLFRCLSDSDYLPSISGDVEEEYVVVLSDRGAFKSWMWYWWQILISLPSFCESFIYWRMTMFLNYLRIAFRIIRKQKGFSFINITGLAVGMACCVLIFLWVQDELSYDRYHENSKELFRVSIRQEGSWLTSSPWALAPILNQEYPEIKNTTRLAYRNLLMTSGDLSYYEDAILIDPDFFEMFTYPFVKGSRDSALSSVQSVVITERTAQKFFGNDNPIGKELTAQNSLKLTVTGVIEDIPSNSHVSFDILASVNLMGKERLESWAYESSTYVLLEKNASVDGLRPKIVGLIEKYDKRIKGERILDLQPLTQLHLYSLSGGGNITNVYLFSTIAFFILIIACINFMNLSTARAGARGREVALRKVVGAHRINIVRQFYGESLIHAIIALVFAILLVFILLPAFNNLAMKNLSLDVVRDVSLLFVLFGITLFAGIVSGSYPALFLSSFLPVKVLKGTFTKNARRPLLRRVLVVIQFTIAIALIIGTTTVSKQMNYIRNKELGFNRHQVLSIPLNNSTRKNFEVLQNEMLQNPNVINVSASANRPTNAPSFPFDYVFLDEVFQEQYRSDQRTGKIFQYFALLAIFISCLGIFGLSAFTAEQRTKEIGVRKVLGATASSIVSLVSREFMMLLVVANTIAWPVSYFLMKRMLDGYAYRTSITIWIFLLAGFLAVLIALLTVSYQAIRASRTDPIQALRYE